MADERIDHVLNYRSPGARVPNKFRRWLAFAALIPLIAAGTYILIMPRFDRVNGRLTPCKENMRVIAQALIKYAEAHEGHLPDSLEAIADDLGSWNLSCFVCPGTNDTPAWTPAAFRSPGHLSYIYIGKGKLLSQLGIEDVILYEPVSNHHGVGGYDLFGDTHNEWLPPSELAKLAAGATSLPESPPTTSPAP